MGRIALKNQSHDLILKDPECKNIRVLCKEIGEENIKTIVAELYLQFVELLNLKNQVTDRQVIVTASDLVDGRPDWKLEEFILFFKMARNGELGKNYATINGIILQEMISNFEEIRADIRTATKVKDETPRLGNVKSFGELKEKLYGRSLKQAEDERKKEILIKANSAQWTKEAIQEWEQSRERYCEETGKDEIYYAQYFPKGDYIKWYIKKITNNL